MRIRSVLFAAFGLLSAGGAQAQLQPLQHVDLGGSRLRASQLSTEAANAIMKGEFDRAISIANEGLALSPHDPWLHYNKGVALFGTHRTDEGVTELDRAEQNFPVEDVWGRSVAVYQRAIKLQQVSRCREANQAFGEYAQMVRDRDPNAAQLAMNYEASGCIIPRELAAAPLGAPVPGSERQPVSGRGVKTFERQRPVGHDRDDALMPMDDTPSTAPYDSPNDHSNP